MGTFVSEVSIAFVFPKVLNARVFFTLSLLKIGDV